MGAKLGLDGKAYRLTTGTRATWGAADSDGFNSGAAPGNLDEVTNLVDLTVNDESGEANVSTRGNNGFGAILPTLKNWTITLNMIYDPADADYIALMKARIANTYVACALLDDDKATVGTRGYWGDFHVMSVEKGEPLEEAQTVDVTLKPALTSVAPEYVKITA